MSEGVFRLEIGVTKAVIDENGHVNNVRYVQWMQDLAVAHWDALGGRAINRETGCTWVARSHHIEFLAPALEGDVIEAFTWVSTFRRVRSQRCYAFRRVRDQRILARGETDWVFVDRETGRPRQIPEEVTTLLPLVTERVASSP